MPTVQDAAVPQRGCAMQDLAEQMQVWCAWRALRANIRCLQVIRHVQPVMPTVPDVAAYQQVHAILAMEVQIRVLHA